MGVRTQARSLVYPTFSDVRLYGAKGNGSTNDKPAIQAAFDSGSSVFIPPGSYNLSTSAIFPDVANSTGRAVIDPFATMNNAKIDMDGLFPRTTRPIFSLDATRKHYGAGFPSGYNNVYQFGHTATVDADGPTRVVAIFCLAEAQAAGKTAWAFNPAAFASNGANAIMIEGNLAVLGSGGGTAYGYFASVTGSNPVESILQLSGNDIGAVAKKLILVDNGDQSMVTEAIVQSGGLTTARGWYTRGFHSISEWDSPGFLVNPGGDLGVRLAATPVNNSDYRLGLVGIAQSGGSAATDVNMTWHTRGTGYYRFRTNGGSGPEQFRILHVASASELLTVQGSTTGNPIIGTTTDSGSANRIISVRGAGTGGVRLQNSTTTRFEVNSTGVGFFGATPVAQSTGWAADSGVARLDALITYLLSRGDLAA